MLSVLGHESSTGLGDYAGKSFVLHPLFLSDITRLVLRRCYAFEKVPLRKEGRSGISLIPPEGFPLYYTSQVISQVGLESGSTGSSFPADSAKPVLGCGLLASRQGQWNLSDYPCPITSSVLAVSTPGEGPEKTVPMFRFPRRHAGDPLSPRCAARRRRTADGSSKLGPPCPAQRPIYVPEGYGSILPTYLALIVPSYRGCCSPWRLICGYDSTTDRAWEALGPPDFQGHTAGAHRTSARRSMVLFLPLDPTSV
ncbi:hypothetical protein Tco_1227234 [Tanacetum coccineum]